jgi:hypothetical protein
VPRFPLDAVQSCPYPAVVETRKELVRAREVMDKTQS